MLRLHSARGTVELLYPQEASQSHVVVRVLLWIRVVLAGRTKKPIRPVREDVGEVLVVGFDTHEPSTRGAFLTIEGSPSLLLELGF